MVQYSSILWTGLMTDTTTTDPTLEGRKDAVKTYIEQTKLLVTLASAFIVAPAAFATLFKERSTNGLSGAPFYLFLFSEGFFVASVLAGYVVLATIAGYQHLGRYDVYRPATVNCSMLQIATYVAGLGLFAALAVHIVG